MSTDSPVPRITRLRIQGLRTLKDVTLDLSGLTVLIGPNGCGKSSVVEACVLLRRLLGESFRAEFHQSHGGFSELRRHDASSIRFEIAVEARSPVPMTYSIEIAELGAGLGVVEERLTLHPGDAVGDVELFVRHRQEALLFDGADERHRLKVPVDVPLVSFLRGAVGLKSMQHAVDAARSALDALDSHLPFATRPRWAARALADSRSMRAATIVEPAARLDLGGLNLANAFHALRNEKSSEHWATTLDDVRLGLGDDVESINTRPDAGGGSIGLTLKRRGIQRQEPAYVLSEGMLAYLAFVAIFRLEAPTSLLVFDEPDVHLHPALLARVVGFAESIGERCPVLMTTHSDRLLDHLSDPVGSVVLMELDERRATKLLRPDRATYERWLDEYRGLGAMRAAGLQRQVFVPDGKGGGGA